ncbi:sulfatase-like hydrolase/transferase [Blastopirellula sp. JC732]|uniref:Sulfatase-like hydrolase/transferase n=1 Tax=Blastopirellula sediminis TaxID=2894196 RepID=A0A9X1MMN3_9BACT|nr:sulfatase-like hydrolase/transferase [Blastopirellula sediminis]MCC9607682.1 sulfatase-like hydrolase/transferase [Blastopirellula sediminis]MCC9629025.1 sulfatase-like hydrolase/transferase [Blastopirellula sediminis]
MSRIASLFFVLLTTSLASAAEKPNILFLFADDYSYECVGAYGHPMVHTPNLDQLAKQGTRFTHAYNMGSWSGAVCVASRTMLNTGRFVWHAEKVYKTADKERVAGRFWSEYMKAAGYDTYMTGKWHVPADAAKAFATSAHIRGGMPNQTDQGYDRPQADGTDYWSPSDPKFGGFWAGGKHWSEVVADDAIGFLETAAKQDKPFFMYLAFNAVHDPRQSPQDFVDRYPADKTDVPADFLPEYPEKEAMGAGKGLRDEKLAPFPRTPHAIQVHRSEYYAIIEHMDVQIGRILDALKATGQADNTYIFFTADHGLACGHHGLMGKQNMYDHSVRVPLLVSGPGLPQGKVCEVPVYLQDVMATALEIAGVAKPDHVEFRSLLPVINGERDVQYEAIYGAYLERQRMITADGYKLILYPTIGKVKLFNLTADPQEMEDLAAKPEQRERISALLQRLLVLQTEVGDKLDLKKAYADWL